jgi:hypothetical protein
MPHRVYLLSPASCGGKRAGYLLREEADFELAQRLRTRRGAPLGEVFTFMSGLYFRGKLAYARRFAQAPPRLPGVQVIVPGRGLLPAGKLITRDDLLAMAEVPVDLEDPRYRQPLERAVASLARTLDDEARVVLLGSIATDKYVSALAASLGERLRFPEEFVGRGDMSRGGLLLRCAEAGEPLRYVKIDAVPRRGKRPPRLAPRDRRVT